MPDLDQALRRLAGDVAWPPTPDVAAAVTARLAAGGTAERPRARSRSAWRRPRRLAVALVVALAGLPAAALALPGPRHAILETLGLRHVTVERRPGPPAGAAPRRGTPTTLAAVPRSAGFVPRVPTALGPPDRVFVDQRIVTFEYRAEGVLLAQARGTLDRAILRKIAGIGTSVRPVRVGGGPGIWLEAPHEYAWTDATGPPVRSGPALVWERNGLVLRLEGPRSLAAALRIARSAS
jgi:hypothetical protein